MAAIVAIQLRRFNELIAQQGLELEATDAAVSLLSREGFDPDFGARPLKRAIQRLVQDPLANLVLSGEVGDGQRIALDAVAGELVLTASEKNPDEVGRKTAKDEVDAFETEIVG
jgi:ATP-dependent Clp protease ATP-binding subunit ClpB